MLKLEFSILTDQGKGGKIIFKDLAIFTVFGEPGTSYSRAGWPFGSAAGARLFGLDG